MVMVLPNSQVTDKSLHFLGFTHFSDKTRKGKFKFGRKTSRKKFTQKMKDMNIWLKSIRNLAELKVWWKVLGLKLLGHYRYYGMSGNIRWLQNFYYQTVRLAFKWINRRSQRKSYNWAQFLRFILFNPLPKPKISFAIQPETVEDALLKSRMRKIFMSGSVRGLIVTLGLLPQTRGALWALLDDLQDVDVALYPVNPVDPV